MAKKKGLPPRKKVPVKKKKAGTQLRTGLEQKGWIGTGRKKIKATKVAKSA